MKLLPSIFLVLVFVMSIFVSASCMFIIEPVIAKMLLPSLGGAGNVWNTCVFFFQLILLLAYLYAHFLNSNKLSAQARAVIHLGVIWLAAYFLPIKMPAAIPDAKHPYFWLLSALIQSIGAIFFALASTAPVLQKWYASTHGPKAKDPYFLYAASNLGSLIGLLSYPFVIERHMGLAMQTNALTSVYFAFAFLVTLCTAFYAYQGKNAPEAIDSSQDADQSTESTAPTKKQYLQWLYLTILPASLVLGMTSFVTCELSAFPLFWMIPLSLYILSFIVAFSYFPEKLLGLIRLLASCGAFVLLFTIIFKEFTYSDFVTQFVSLHLSVLFLISLACHAKVASSRPRTRYLTNYYLVIALGGIIGSSLNTFVAPVILKDLSEYQIVLALSASTLLCTMQFGKWRVPTKAIPWVVASSVLGVLLINDYRSDPRVVLTKRNFFGLTRIKVDNYNNLCEILDGATVHGGQSLDPQERMQPYYYYSEESPIWSLLKVLTHSIGLKKHGIIGMGAGTMAAYAAPGQKMTMFEINPNVISIATNPFYFTFIYDAVKRKAKVDIKTGDGRIEMAKEPDKSFSYIVVDAYSSDAIPLHLMTKEAIALYQNKLTDGGAISFHITSTYYDVSPVLAKTAQSLGLYAIYLDDYQKKDSLAPEEADSKWVVLAKDPALVRKLIEEFKWKPIKIEDDVRLWTDDYCDILSVLREPFS
ncbi:MAG: fused MFS/spermidine synthase [Candidatus Melainabacteria bacterium]|nr:fused MFS/spermidine synthase [Candidatus Melainabacteria bacterium]